jgi:hypothetical protein
MSLASYRLHATVYSALFITLAFASKAYRGPWWRIADAYIGDVMVVGFLFFVLSALLPRLATARKFWIVFVYAVLVELFQATGLPASWHLRPPLSYAFGSSFDAIDLIAYAVGVLLAAFLDRFPK